jgi:hypothetical protein
MAKDDKPIELERIPCEVCLREVPKSEAIVPEATEYFLYFCGLDCYQRWKRQGAKPRDQAEQSAS